MSDRQHRRRRPEGRRRPGRRPTDRRRGRVAATPDPHRPQGFTGPGWGELSRVVLPYRGRDRRLFFNGLSDWLVTFGGLSAAAVGYGLAGPLGAAAGLAAGLTGSAKFLTKNRFRR